MMKKRYGFSRRQDIREIPSRASMEKHYKPATMAAKNRIMQSKAVLLILVTERVVSYHCGLSRDCLHDGCDR